MFCPRCGTQLSDDASYCLKCGAKVAFGGEQVQSARKAVESSGAAILKCPTCGAPISPKFGEMIVTCEYCGSSVTLGTEGWKSVNKHTMLPLNVADKDAVLKVVHDLMDRGLLHRHLQESSVLEEMSLAIVPYWLVPVSARTSLVATDMAAEAGQIATTAVLAGILGSAMSGGRRGGGGGMMTGVLLGTMMGGQNQGGNRRAYQMDLAYNYPVIALKALAEYQPKDYAFALSERMIFDERKVKGMKVMNGDVSEDVALT